MLVFFGGTAFLHCQGKKVATSSASTNTSSVTPSKRADATEESKVPMGWAAMLEEV